MTARAVDGALALAASDPGNEGLPILLVHGFSHNRRVWLKLGPSLPGDLRPIAVDLRGHGESPWSLAGDYGLESYAGDLSRLLDDRGISRAVVVGHSLGGNVSTLLAAAEPDRVAALVLLDTGPALESGGTGQITDDVGRSLRSYARIEQFREQLAALHPQGDGEILDALARSSLVRRLDGRFEPALDPGVLGSGSEPADLGELERELWAALRAVRCPTLLVRGALSSVLSQKVAHEMVDEVLDRGELVTLPAAGHAVMIDDGPGLAGAIRSFLGRALGRAAAT